MDNRNQQDKNQKLNPNERNRSEQKHSPGQDHDGAHAGKKDGNQNQDKQGQQGSPPKR
jgi:hypothetical protein